MSGFRRRGRRGTAGGFSLIELLVVLGLTAALAAWLLGGTDRGSARALQSAQAAIANAISAARTHALATGVATRVLVHLDAESAEARERYLRQIVVQVQTSSGWRTLTAFRLPPSVYVLPGNFPVIPTGLLRETSATPWVRSDGTTALRSTALRSNAVVLEAVLGPTSEHWASIGFAATGTTAQSGDLVLALGRERSVGAFSPGESPVELLGPDLVRGLAVSSYGMTAFVDERTSF